MSAMSARKCKAMNKNTAFQRHGNISLASFENACIQLSILEANVRRFGYEYKQPKLYDGSFCRSLLSKIIISVK